MSKVKYPHALSHPIFTNSSLSKTINDTISHQRSSLITHSKTNMNYKEYEEVILWKN